MEKESGKLLVLAANLLMHIQKENRLMNDVRIASTVITLSLSPKIVRKDFALRLYEYKGKTHHYDELRATT